jgi:drug/metabolite transporter (DMT)-like permease
MSAQKAMYAGTVMVLVSAVCLSAKAIFAKLAYRHGVDPTTLLALRAAVSLPFFALLGLRSSAQPTAIPLLPRERVQLFLLGSAGYYLASLLDFVGLQYVSAGLERLILFLYPTLVIGLNMLFYRERPNRNLLDAVVLSYGGVGLVVWNDRATGSSNVALGSLFVFFSAVAYAGYISFSQPLIVKHGSTRVTGHILSVTCLCAIAQFLVQGELSRLQQPWQVFALSSAIGLLATVLPAFLLTAGMKRLGTSKASLLGTVGPVSTLFLAAWFLDEPITLLQVSGSALVILGILRVGRAEGPTLPRAELTD